jgi:hypothetical protein
MEMCVCVFVGVYRAKLSNVTQHLNFDPIITIIIIIVIIIIVYYYFYSRTLLGILRRRGKRERGTRTNDQPLISPV